MPIMRALLIALGLLAMSADRTWSEPAAADYPNRQVNFIVPFAPGGSTDILGRLLGQKLSERFGKPFVIENRPGAGTVTAAVQVAKSAADGHTIMMATSGTMAMNTTLYRKLPYEPGKDLVLVALICHVPFVLVVNPELPINSVADLVKLAKERQLSYGSGGAGAFHHLMGELFKTTLGIPMTHVPYKGNGQAIADLIGGHVSMMVLSLSTILGSVKAGQLFALAVTTPERSKLLPDVPTIAESAVPGFSAAIRYGLVAPAGTPAPILERLSRELRAAVMSEEVQERMLSEGAQPLASTPAEYAAEIDSEERKWSALVKSLNLKIE